MSTTNNKIDPTVTLDKLIALLQGFRDKLNADGGITQDKLETALADYLTRTEALGDAETQGKYYDKFGGGRALAGAILEVNEQIWGTDEVRTVFLRDFDNKSIAQAALGLQSELSNLKNTVQQETIIQVPHYSIQPGKTITLEGNPVDGTWNNVPPDMIVLYTDQEADFDALLNGYRNGNVRLMIIQNPTEGGESKPFRVSATKAREIGGLPVRYTEPFFDKDGKVVIGKIMVSPNSANISWEYYTQDINANAFVYNVPEANVKMGLNTNLPSDIVLDDSECFADLVGALMGISDESDSVGNPTIDRIVLYIPTDTEFPITMNLPISVSRLNTETGTLDVYFSPYTFIDRNGNSYMYGCKLTINTSASVATFMFRNQMEGFTDEL